LTNQKELILFFRDDVKKLKTITAILGEHEKF